MDADINTNLASDIAGFDSQFSLPTPTVTTVAVTVNGIAPVNATSGDNWALETDLDVEYAHALAPGAKIDVFETPNSLTGLLGGVLYAADYSQVRVISCSWGANEFSGESSYDYIFTTPASHVPVAFVAGSGDTPASGPQYHASSPNVVAVGGTMLSGGTSGTEEWWANGSSGSEGGVSAQEGFPTFQDAVDANRTAGSGAVNPYNSSGRITPDVAMLASSVSVYDITNNSTSAPWSTGVQGTSLSSPLFAAVVALADDGRKAYASQNDTLDGPQVLLPSLYGLHVNGRASDFNDIESSSGSGPGFDEVTGLGTPNVPSFVNDLANVDSVLGGTGNDTMSASVSGSTLTVTTNGSPTNFTVYSGTSIFINGEAGNDSISVPSTVTLPTVMFGAGGNDTVAGGGGADFINGGGADDSVSGGPGNDFLVGGDGPTSSDSFSGGGGNDTLVAGGGGSSSLSAGTGTNLFVSDQGVADSLASLGTGDSGYYDDGPTIYDSISGTISLL